MSILLTLLFTNSNAYRYDEILVNGLPDWRQPVYYYRRVRKMGMLELLLILLFIITIGQIVLGWASYLEKKLVLVSSLG